MKHAVPLLLISLLSLVAVGCQQSGGTGKAPESESPSSALSASDEVRAEGLHNVYRITDRLFSGSSPDGEVGFRSLQKLGVRTVISVDGARPDLDGAHKYGLRYVHLPIGYDGMSRQRALELAKAVRDLPGPVYIHCHHGKHRGPAAAATVHLCLDQACSIERAVAEMRRAGTDPRYTGLYALPKTLARPTTQELDRIPADFPEAAAVSDLAQIMVDIDTRWENLKRVQAAGWKTPPDHPDLDPPHEALQVVENYREAGRLKQTGERTEEFRRWLAAAEEDTTKLERVLRPGTERGAPDRAAADEAFRKAGASCVRCHAKYRDIPQQQ